MVAVIFELVPKRGKRVEYLDLAAELKREVINIEGFISIERFQSLTDPEKVLSLSFWENEESIQQWRNFELHRIAQEKGRNGVFAEYRLRVAAVVRDYGMHNREQAPSDSKVVHQ